MKKEIEIKIKLRKGETDILKNKLKKLGGIKIKSEKETTYGFFTEDDSSIEKGIFPRIKSINKGKSSLLTVKVKTKEDKDYFRRNEFEITINDINTARDMIKAMGFSKERIFEKLRESWLTDNSSVTINFDTLLFGEYFEIESDPQKIETWLKKLNLEKREKIAKAYLGIFDDWRKKNNIRDENAILK